MYKFWKKIRRCSTFCLFVVFFLPGLSTGCQWIPKLNSKFRVTHYLAYSLLGSNVYNISILKKKRKSESICSSFNVAILKINLCSRVSSWYYHRCCGCECNTRQEESSGARGENTSGYSEGKIWSSVQLLFRHKLVSPHKLSVRRTEV